MSGPTSFSSSGEDVIARSIELNEDDITTLSQDELDDYYEINRTVDQIVQGDYARIALQFPDELLHDSVPIFRALKSKIGSGRELYVLADTSYGRQAFAPVFWDHSLIPVTLPRTLRSCVYETSRLPVIYIFGKRDVDPADCAKQLLNSLKTSSMGLESRSILFRHDVAYSHQADAILMQLRDLLPPSAHIFHSSPTVFMRPRDKNVCQATSDALTENSQPTSAPSGDPGSMKDYAVIYIGGESLTLTNLLVTHSFYEVHAYDPRTRVARLESARTNKLLMRRYSTMQKARDADVFGILIGTLGVGKLNPAKLANFLEIECFVLVACPENSIIEAKEFLRPIVTPYELEIALQAEQSWTGQYILDFNTLLAESRNDADDTLSEVQDEGLDQPIFSLVTGRYRQAKRYGDSANGENDARASALVLRNRENAVATSSNGAAGMIRRLSILRRTRI
ncbi:uncharacterized protein FIBRA_00895 [Fibroporia radiculosa]|uniref:2-(3-amino-3-carboxypropyl)histidine synthase subunit 2 n=1 Tax=Fibroporia radiculosa TaxID=599839 RepID=J4G0N8_9APHY|nr:uncharacterized protein FIBRA_00895 [Fibroporia radiculosa]CCL98888.1 predicted protein [Fibroporia radiculosa]